jgi:hypothetical protein
MCFYFSLDIAGLALALLMLRVGANDADHAGAVDDLALVAHLLN